jgi:hypothetical protein
MRELPSKFATVALLLFLDILMLAIFLDKPYMVIAAVVFLEGPAALAAVGTLIAASLVLIFLVLRRYGRVRIAVASYAIILMMNSAAILLSAPFISADLAGFLEHVLGKSSLAGFLTLQALIILNNALLLMAQRHIQGDLRKDRSRAIPL